ncbi:uncharacterized protein [Montipora capricornis]|uniref:uncharacterized protein n=1 Tax=Montipora capricornis TaxID=246305 RepID=UPI0035F127DD
MSREDIKFCETVESGIVHLEDLHYELPLPFKHQKIQLPNNYVQAEKRLTGLKKRLKADARYYADYCSFMAGIIFKGYARKVNDEREDEVRRTWYLPHHWMYHPQKSKVLWPNGDLEQKADEYCMTVHLFGAVSSPACAKYALQRTADGNEDNYGTEVANTLRRNFYVDDVLKSASTEDKAIDLVKDVKEQGRRGARMAKSAVCRNGGLNLTKFVGNTERIIKSIRDEHRADNVKSLTLGQNKLPIDRALGVIWCIESDTFNFKIELKDKPCTRRGILSTISSIDDPLGFIAPVVLVGKKILQDICQSNSWDEPVDDATKNRWEKWRNELCLLESLKVPRSFKPAEFGRIVSAQLHCMSDASTCEYGQCSYVRLEDESRKVHVSFVMGKARVTPKKIVSISRLELAAATISINIGDKLKYELGYDDIKDYYWTDSTVVLGLISNESRRFHTYVANRVQLIHEYTISSQRHYVETALNTADEGSRGMSPKDFVEKSEWIGSPDFLKEPVESWLKEESYDAHVDSDSPEVKNVKVNISAVKESSDILKRLRRFSSWFKAKVAVALCLKYSGRLRDRVLAKRKVFSGLASDEEPAGASRAVQIEVADSLETDSFINALRRFISRRGSVREIHCDRGTNFIGAEAELKKAIEEIDDQEIKAELLKVSIDWIKNPASDSNFGGVWERQIRSIKNVMNGLIRERGSHLQEDSLRIFLCEAEYTINNRPLTVETISDPHSVPPLSPNMLLTGKTRLVLPPPQEFKREDLYCTKMWRRTHHVAQEFWSRWSKEYLQQLQARNKWIRPRRNFQVGDVVLLKENQSPRNRWPMAKVVATHPDDSGQVRSVTVLASNRSKLERPVNKLVLLVEA